MANADDFSADDTPISFEIGGLEELQSNEDGLLDEQEYTEAELNEMYDKYVQNNLLQVEVADAVPMAEQSKKEPKKRSRFVKVNEEKADKIATKAVKDRTHTQTRWALKVFKGKYINFSH